MATNYDKFEYDLIQAESLDDYFKHLDAGQNLLPIGGIQLDDLPAVKIGTTEAKEVREILGDLPLMLRNIKNSYLTVDLMPNGIAYDNTSLNNVFLIKLDIVNWFDLLYNTAKRADIVTNMANLAIARDKTVELNEKLTNYENKTTNDALRDADEQLDNGEERPKEDEQAKDSVSNNDDTSDSHQDSASNSDDASDSHQDSASNKDDASDSNQNSASNSDQDSASNDTPSDDNKLTSDNNAENQANNENDENSQDDTANSNQDSASNDTPSNGTKPTSDNNAENQANTKNDENSQDDTANSDQDSASNDTPRDGTKPTSDNTAENQTNTENDEQAKDGNALNSDQDSASNDTPSNVTKPTSDNTAKNQANTENDENSQDGNASNSDPKNPDNSQNTDSTNNADGTDGNNASSELDDLEKESLPHNVTNNVINRPFSAKAPTEMAKQDDKLQQVKTAAENAKANINPESQADVPSVKMQTPPVQVTNSTGQDTQTQLLTKMMETLNLVLKRETKKDKDTQAPKAFSELTPNERLAKFRSEQDQLIASMIAKQI